VARSGRMRTMHNGEIRSRCRGISRQAFLRRGRVSIPQPRRSLISLGESNSTFSPGRARHFLAEDDVEKISIRRMGDGIFAGGLPGISRRAKLNRISRGIKWYLTGREDARWDRGNKAGTHATLRILSLGVNVTVSLYDFRIDGLVAWNARKLRK